MVLRRSLPRAMCLMALIATGCGGDEPADDRRAVEQTMRTFLTALAEGDGARACDQLTPDAKDQVVRLTAKTLDAGAASCTDALDNFARNTGADVAEKVCGARADAECRRIASEAATGVLDKTKDVELQVQVSGDAATAGPAAGPEGYDGRLRKVDGTWRVSSFQGL
jgi:hypothetical protein